MGNKKDVFSAPFARWLEAVVGTIVELNAGKISINAILPSGEVFSSYYECSVQDMAVIAGSVQTDMILHTLEANGYRREDSDAEE